VASFLQPSRPFWAMHMASLSAHVIVLLCVTKQHVRCIALSGVCMELAGSGTWPRASADAPWKGIPVSMQAIDDEQQGPLP